MKLIPLAALTLALPLAVSGCSSSPSIEQQTKLVEYEKCLEVSQMTYSLYVDAVQRKNPSFNTLNSFSEKLRTSEIVIEELQKVELKDFLEECKQYRP